ncbi:hypothetical protein L3X38_040662 [Prunus dulcis]|uniref:Uncharacterized protein n=1 Tax=Prunus dulcis TaxID=3755 RepID=A0AAD4V9G0_PRUDU|nr:hypothetical protein L3X38_040662 [Prunus dulcis]
MHNSTYISGEAFEAVEKEIGVLKGDKEKSKDGEEKEEIPAKVIAESIELAKRQQEAQRTEPTSSELPLFDEVDTEHSAAVPEPEIPIHSILGSSTTTSFADPELAEFEAMDLDAQLDRLEKLGATPSKAKSRAVDEAVERVRIWQSTELDLDKNKEAVDQLMKDLDLLHSENMTPKAILERSLHHTSLTYSHCITKHYTIYILKKNVPMHRCHMSNKYGRSAILFLIKKRKTEYSRMAILFVSKNKIKKDLV